MGTLRSTAGEGSLGSTKTQLPITDTTHEASQMHTDLLRRAGPERRLQLASSISTSAMKLTEAGIRRRHPEWSEMDVGLRFISLCYGRELSARLRSFLQDATA